MCILTTKRGKTVSDNNDPLDDLFEDENEVIDRTVLASALQSYVTFTREGKLIPKEQFDALKNTKKILVLLLSKKALNLKLGTDEKTSPKELEEISGIPIGSIKPTVRQLVTKRLLRSENGTYWIPDYAVTKVNAFLNE